jgi:hypothetical protein
VPAIEKQKLRRGVYVAPNTSDVRVALLGCCDLLHYAASDFVFVI